MSDPSRKDRLRGLRNDWRGFGRDAPLTYAVVGADASDRAGFFASGARDVSGILAFVGPVSRKRALDLGCGPGRLLPALAAHFDHVDGADIAPEMIDAAKSAGLPSNVALTVTSGADLKPFADASFDLVVSLLVFQHIPYDDVVRDLMGEVQRVLAAEGRAFIQFDSRPSSRAAHVVQRLPDWLLPRIRRRHIRRYRRPPAQIAALVEESGLSVVRDEGAGSGSHHLVFRRAV